MRGERRRVAARMVAAIVVLSGVSLGDGCAGGANVVKIGVIAPSTGPLAALGTGITKAVRLAIEEANEAGAIDGWRIEIDARDDGSDPRRGVAAARKLAADPRVVGVIGTYNSGVAAEVQPVLDDADVVMVSPGNTNPTLTLGPDWRTAPKRQHDNYFRVVSTDREQGLFGARYAYDTLGLRRAVVIHESKDVSKNLGLIFDEAFRAKGGTVRDVIEADGEEALRSAVARARREDPQVVFIGGEYPAGGLVVKAMREQGMRPPEVVALGGDGLVDPEFVTVAGEAAAQGHYASLVGATTDLLPGSGSFTSAYRDRYDSDVDWSAFGPPAYDAANILIEALKDLLAGRDEVDRAARKELIEAVQEAKHAGIVGTTSFDAFGDTTNRLLTMNRVEGDDWKALEADRL